MECKECRDILFTHAEHNLRKSQRSPSTEELSAELREHLSECSGCAAVAAALRLSFSEAEFTRSTPSGTVERVRAGVMQRVRAEAEHREPRFPQKRVPVFRRAAAFAAAAILLVAASVSLTLLVTERRLPGGAPVVQSAEQNGGETGESSVIKVYLSLEAPQAESVAVVGDWNGWDPEAQPMQDRNGDGVWELRITIDKSGEYKYQFLINGEKWIPDPNAPLKVHDGFGGTNSVLDL